MCSPYNQLYNYVFSLLQKPANVRVESWIVNGSAFQGEGPEVARLHDLYCASHYAEASEC